MLLKVDVSKTDYKHFSSERILPKLKLIMKRVNSVFFSQDIVIKKTYFRILTFKSTLNQEITVNFVWLKKSSHGLCNKSSNFINSRPNQLFIGTHLEQIKTTARFLIFEVRCFLDSFNNLLPKLSSGNENLTSWDS